MFIFLGPVQIDLVENYNQPRRKRENLLIVAWDAAETETAATPAEVNLSIIILSRTVFKLYHYVSL